jgi:hypothetical protein
MAARLVGNDPKISRVFGPKGSEIGTFTESDFCLPQGPLMKSISTGSGVINEVVLGTSVNKGNKKGRGRYKKTPTGVGDRLHSEEITSAHHRV